MRGAPQNFRKMDRRAAKSVRAASADARIVRARNSPPNPESDSVPHAQATLAAQCAAPSTQRAAARTAAEHAEALAQLEAETKRKAQLEAEAKLKAQDAERAAAEAQHAKRAAQLKAQREQQEAQRTARATALATHAAQQKAQQAQNEAWQAEAMAASERIGAGAHGRVCADIVRRVAEDSTVVLRTDEEALATLRGMIRGCDGSSSISSSSSAAAAGSAAADNTAAAAAMEAACRFLGVAPMAGR